MERLRYRPGTAPGAPPSPWDRCFQPRAASTSAGAQFYCDLLEKWAKTDVDALSFMDDWGSQRSLLISPAMWERMFLPMYREYIEIAHSHSPFPG